MANPADSPGRGEPIARADLRGRSYPGATAAMLDLAARWLVNGPVANAETLKAGAVFAFDGVVIKQFQPLDGVAGMLRRVPAVRAAEEFYRVQGVRAPRPLVAGYLPGQAAPRSILLSEQIRGELLTAAWHTTPAARDALPHTVAALFSNRVLHGDLHAANLMWTGEELALLDLEAMRNPAHSVRRLETRWWLSLLRSLHDDPGVRHAHARYIELRGGWISDERAWQRVLALRAARQRAQRR